MLFKGAMANQAQGMMLCALFALTYVIMRVIVDKAVPGNVRYPLMVDKIGSAVVGVIAGIFTMGILVLAAGSLPFGPSIAGYARYSVADRTVIVPQGGRDTDAATDSEVNDVNLDADKVSLDPNKRNGLILPVDDILAGVVGQLSAGAVERSSVVRHASGLADRIVWSARRGSGRNQARAAQPPRS